MERRYNIVDIEDIQSAKELMQKRRRATHAEDAPKANRAKPGVTAGNQETDGDSGAGVDASEGGETL